jgi:hypothetical protein
MDTDSDEIATRLDSAMNERRLELRLRWNQVAERAEMTPGNLHKIRRGHISLTELAKTGLENALQWPRGHIDQLVESWRSEPPAPFTDLQQIALDKYRHEYLPKYGHDKVGRDKALERLRRDVDAINDAIEREQRSAG